MAALATLEDLASYRKNFRRILATRERAGRGLTLLGFRVLPSQTNFLFVRPPARPAKEWLRRLRERKILVRWFDDRETKDYLRITIGTDAEMSELLQAAREIVFR